MKKAISILISGIMMTSSMPLATFAAEDQPVVISEIDSALSGSYSENITWTLDADGKLTLSGEGEIPDRDGITPWFDQMVNIKTIVVGEGITKIGKGVFLGLESVTSASLPDGIKSIDDSAFEECVNLKNVNIPEGVESIGNESFYKCALESLELPDSIKTIGEKAFVSGNFGSIELPSGITRLENGALGSCEYLNEVTIPDTVTYIGGTFGYCKSLTSITIPESVEEISYKAFAHCTNLETIIFENPDTVIIDEEGDVHDSFFYAWGGDDFKGVVKGYKGSKAEEYAIKYNTGFETLISEKSGDSNGDGRIDMSDAVLIMQTIANPSKYKLTEQGSKNADMDGDGVTNADALAIQKKLLKLE